MSDNLEIGNSEIKNEQDNSTIASAVTKRIRKKKGEGKATNIVISENNTDAEINNQNEISVETPIVTKRIRKKKGEGKATNIVISENNSADNENALEAPTVAGPDTTTDNTVGKEEKVHKKRGRKVLFR